MGASGRHSHVLHQLQFVQGWVWHIRARSRMHGSVSLRRLAWEKFEHQGCLCKRAVAVWHTACGHAPLWRGLFSSPSCWFMMTTFMVSSSSSINQSINYSINQSINQSISQHHIVIIITITIIVVSHHWTFRWSPDDCSLWRRQGGGGGTPDPVLVVNSCT